MLGSHPPHLQNVRDHSQRPHIHRGTIELAANDLRSTVSRSAAERVQGLIALRLWFTSYRSPHVSSKAKVGDPDVQEIVRRLEQNVLRLQIAVDDALLVAISQRV